MQSYKSKIKKRFQVINSLKDYMEQGFRYEKDCLSKKERTTCIGNGNSGENPTRRVGATARQERFNVKNAFFTHLQRLNVTLQCHDVNHQRCKCSVLLATNREIYTKHSYFLFFQKYLYCFLTYRQIGILLC